MSGAQSGGRQLAIAVGAAVISAASAIIVGLLVHDDARHSVHAQYVALAVGILSAPKVDERPDLRGWATDVLNELSDVRLTVKDRADLRAGRIILPVGAALIGEAKDTVRGKGDLTAPHHE